MPYKKGTRARKRERAARYAVYAAFVFLIVFLAATVYLYSNGEISQTNYLAYASIAQSFIFSAVVLTYMLATGRSFKLVIAQLGLSRKSLRFRYILYGLGIFGAIFLVEIGLTVFQAATGISLPTNVSQVFTGLPIYFLVFTVLVVPINEEILFRGVFVPEWWIKLRKHKTAWAIMFILFSASFFGFLHYLSYNSISEFFTAFVFGLIAGYVRLKTKSLYPSITAHALINFLGVLALAII